MSFPYRFSNPRASSRRDHLFREQPPPPPPPLPSPPPAPAAPPSPIAPALRTRSPARAFTSVRDATDASDTNPRLGVRCMYAQLRNNRVQTHYTIERNEEQKKKIKERREHISIYRARLSLEDSEPLENCSLVRIVCFISSWENS